MLSSLRTLLLSFSSSGAEVRDGLNSHTWQMRMHVNLRSTQVVCGKNERITAIVIQKLSWVLVDYGVELVRMKTLADMGEDAVVADLIGMLDQDGRVLVGPGDDCAVFVDGCPWFFPHGGCVVVAGPAG